MEDKNVELEALVGEVVGDLGGVRGRDVDLHLAASQGTQIWIEIIYAVPFLPDSSVEHPSRKGGLERQSILNRRGQDHGKFLK